MEFICSINIEDYIEADKMSRKTNFIYKCYQKICLCCIVPIIQIIVSYKAFLDGHSITALFIIFIAICFALFSYFLYPNLVDRKQEKKLRLNSKLNKGITNPVKVCINEESFTISTNEKKSSINLDKISRIIESNHKIFIVNKWGSVIFVIPENTFSSPLEKKEFITLIAHKIKKFKNF